MSSILADSFAADHVLPLYAEVYKSAMPLLLSGP
jgi:hypothetical protein